jgi:hypothetical protein
MEKQPNKSVIIPNFAQQHQIKKFFSPRYVTFRYTFLEQPIFKKNVYYTGRVKWYFIGMYFLKRKKIK